MYSFIHSTMCIIHTHFILYIIQINSRKGHSPSIFGHLADGLTLGELSISRDSARTYFHHGVLAGWLAGTKVCFEPFSHHGKEHLNCQTIFWK